MTYNWYPKDGLSVLDQILIPLGNSDALRMDVAIFSAEYHIGIYESLVDGEPCYERNRWSMPRFDRTPHKAIAEGREWLKHQTTATFQSVLEKVYDAEKHTVCVAQYTCRGPAMFWYIECDKRRKAVENYAKNKSGNLLDIPPAE